MKKEIISVTLKPETIKRLKKKAEELNLSVSSLLELIIKGVVKI